MTATLNRPAETPPASEPNPAPTFEHAIARKSSRAYIVLFVVTLLLTPLLILVGADQGYGTILAALAALIALALVPWKPIWGLYLVVICAVVVEQEPLPGTPIGTDHVNIFYWPTHLQGLPERPIGFFILAILFFMVIAAVVFRRRALYGGRLFYPFLFFFACLAIGVLHGLATGGSFRIIVLEIRPWWYFFVSYLLAYNIVSEVKHVRNIIWITVLGTAIKGVQGVFIVYTYLGGQIEGHNEIMAHEQSFFFVLVLLLLVMLLLHHFQRALFFAIIFSLPCLLLALVANNRRADYVALLLGILVAWAMVILVKPASRRALVIVLAVCLLFGGVYVLAFQKSSGALGQPARAVISVFNPSASDERDASSNAYRIVENYDLRFTESTSPILGYGFGKPFLQPVALPNVLELDPYYLYIPHNNVLWVWMRLGPLGFGALWYLFGSAIVAGCMIVRRLRNPQLQFFAIFTLAMVTMEVILAYGDYQFFFYRNMIYVGVALGVLMKLPSIERKAMGEPSSHADNLDEAIPRDRTKPRPRARLDVPRSLPVPVSAMNTRVADEALGWKWTHS
ncbi:MAG TPA: O-antigen ligase family protein [Ktedonobacterales bacterium]|nr:O-antigen ligase family protein [Ktedonobacterales bacterium]